MLSCVWLFVTPRTSACQAPLSSTISWSLLKFTFIGRWCDLGISSSTTPLSFCLQSVPASGSFSMSRLFASAGQSIGASVTDFPMNIYGWYTLGLTGLISLLCKGLSKVFSSTVVRKHQFFSAQPSLWSNSHIIPNYWKNHSFDYMDFCWHSDVSAF